MCSWRTKNSMMMTRLTWRVVGYDDAVSVTARLQGPAGRRDVASTVAVAPRCPHLGAGCRPSDDRRRQRRRRRRRQVRRSARRQDLAKMLSALLPALQHRLLDHVHAARWRRPYKVISRLRCRRHLEFNAFSRDVNRWRHQTTNSCNWCDRRAFSSWSFHARHLSLYDAHFTPAAPNFERRLILARERRKNVGFVVELDFGDNCRKMQNFADRLIVVVMAWQGLIRKDTGAVHRNKIPNVTELNWNKIGVYVSKYPSLAYEDGSRIYPVNAWIWRYLGSMRIHQNWCVDHIFHTQTRDDVTSDLCWLLD